MAFNDYNEYWFPANRYGWGWGLPCRWQGWAVLTPFVAVFGLLIVFVPPDEHPRVFFISLFLLSVLSTLIFWLKGEPAKWR